MLTFIQDNIKIEKDDLGMYRVYVTKEHSQHCLILNSTEFQILCQGFDSMTEMVYAIQNGNF